MNRDIVTPIELPVLVKVREGVFREVSTGLIIVMVGNKPVYVNQCTDETMRRRARAMGLSKLSDRYP